MSHPFIADVIRSTREAATSAEAMRAFALRFYEQPLFFPQASQAGAPEGKRGFRLIGESASELKLLCTPDAAAIPKLQSMAGGDATEGHGAVALYMAGVARFDLVIFDSESDEIWQFDHQQLLAMQQVQKMDAGTPLPPTSAAEVSHFYPDALAAWLYDYCLGEKDISRAWIAMCSNDYKPVADVCVVFDEFASARHDGPVREQVGLLSVGQSLLSGQSLDKATRENGGEGVVAIIRRSEPFFDRNHKQGWWARRQRRVGPKQIVWLTLDTIDEPAKA